MGLNRIYKVIWSKTKGCYVVVSEMAKRVGRNKAKAIVMSTAAMAMAVAVAPAVMNVDRVEAAVLIGTTENNTETVTKINNNKSTVSSWGITIGGGVTKAGDHSVLIGDATGSVGTRNVVIGTYATAGYDEHRPGDNPEKGGDFNQSVAIGAGSAAGLGARAYGDQSIAIGSNTIARGNSSIAIGNDDVDKTDTINTTYTDLEGHTKQDTIGNAYRALTGQNLGPGVYVDTTSKEAAVAIGVKAVAGDISLALGTGANADRVNGVAIGSGATVTRDNAVAIGGGATTEKAGTQELGADINGLHFTWAGGKDTIAGDVVSFGKAGYERQLKNVAPGNVSKDSTDGINGSQFFGVLSHLTADPVYFYGADDSTDGKIEGVEAKAKSADAIKKKVVARSMADSRLNLKGGATGELTDNNIGVVYGDERTIKFKLAKELSGLTSAEFKDANNNVVNITPTGVSVKKPNATDANTVTLSQNGLNNGGNAITNVAGNLQGSKTGSTTPTTSATAPTLGTGTNEVNKNNVATVGDVLEAGWNLQNNSTEKDFVKPYDTVNFADGNGTTAVVDTTENKTSTVKYNVNLGNGLEKNSANQITIKPADTSLKVDNAGVKVKTDGTTITTDTTDGLKVVTGGIEAGTTPGTMKVTDGDNNKIATVDSVVNAVNNAAFTLKASAIEGGTRNTGSTVTATGESIKAGSTIEMIAGKNLEVTHNKNGKITFATVDNPSFSTVQVGDSEGPKFSATADGNIRVSDKDDTNPVKITNVKDGVISNTSKDAINGSQFYKLANNTIKLAGQNGEEEATETDPQNLNQKDGIKFTVKSSDGKLLEVTAGSDTITLTPKTGTITTTDGVPTAVTKNGKLVTVDEVVKALKDLGWKATAGTDGTGTMIGDGATEELIKAGNTVTFKAGNNLSIKQDGKNFIYSLNPALTGLTSAEFKDGDNKVKITPTGITITKPAGTTENTVTLNQNGLNNGGNPITNVAGNLQGAKAGTDAPTTSATAPTLGTGADEVNKNNAATVGDVLNAGWNLQEKGAPKDFVKPYDTVNFIDGDGTSVAVATGNDGTTSTVKYSVNLGNGLEKTTDNKITVKPADTSLEVTTAGLKAKTDNTTITTGDNGLKVVTGGIKEDSTTPGTVKVTDGDTGKIATVDSVVNAVNSAAFTLKASATTDGTRNTGSTVDANGESIKAGNTIEMIAGKNLNVTHNTNGKITFATVENPSFNTVQIGNSEGPKFSATADGNIKVSDKDDTKPVKITNVADGTISDSSKDAINGSQIHKLVNKAIKLAGQNGDDASGETEPQTLTQKDPIKFTVKSSDGKLLEVTAGGDTITLTPKTGTITTTDGVPTATTTNGKLVTADEVVKALKDLGWKATAGTDGTGTMIGTGAAEELIKAGNTVTFKAGDNLSIKQDGKNFIYSLKTDLKDLTSAEFKDANNNTVKITPNGVSFKKPNATDADTVTLNQNGLNNGGNPITNVAGNLQGAKAGTDAPTTSATAPSLGTGTDQVNKNNAATVGDVLNAGWNLQNNDAAKDFVKPYDTVNFVDGDGTTAVVETTDQTTSKIKYNVNTGKGLEKTTDNKITVKPGDKSLEVTDDGLKVKVDGTTIKTGDTGLTVNTGTINTVTEGNTAGTVVAKTGDENKIATVSNVVEAINNAAWTATSAATTAGELGAAATNQLVKAGDKVTFEADKNIKITQDAGKFTFATKDNVTFETVQVGGDQGPKFSKSAAGDIKVSGSDNTTPVKITNVKDGEISKTSTDAINGSQFHKLANNTITLQGQTGNAEKSSTKAQKLDTEDGIKFTVKSSDGSLLEVTAADDTITLTPKTGTITTGTNGVPTANTDGGKLVTADQLVTALTEMGWKATAGTEGTGTMIGAGATEELIKAGNTVTFKAGDNLSIKQDGKNFIYSLNPALTGLTSAEFKDGKNNKVNITPEGITITKPADPTAGTPENTVTLNQNGLNNGGNPITNVTSNLVNYSDPVVNGKAPVRNELRKFDNNAVPNTNVATVGDLRNMGWVVSSNKTTGDLGNPYSETVKNADEVKFVGTGLATVSGKTENGVRTITVDVESKTAINAVTYTKPDGTKVYPVEGPTGTTYHTTPEGKGPNDETVDGSNVITSVNGPKGTKTPSTLSNVKSNLPDTKNSDTANTADAPSNATKVQAAPNTTNTTGDTYVNPNNAATVSDVLNAGWNLQSNGAAVDFVKAYDTVNFINGDGTTATVESTDGKTSTVKYNVNLGNGLEKNAANQITVKPADSSLVVDAAGVKVNTGTINNVTTGDKPGTVAPNTDDDTKLATVGNVVSAINNAAWTATSAKTEAGELGAAATNQLVKAGDKVTFEADKNIKITQDAGKFTFATKDNVTFTTVQVGGDQGPKFSKTDAGDIKVSGSDNTTPVKITNVQDGDISADSKDAINGSQFHAVAKNKIKLAGQNGTSAATETDEQELDKKGGIKFTVKSSDGTLLDVAAKGDTITLTPKTATITTGADGIPTANTDGGKLVTADNLVNALTEMGWKATAGTDGTGTMIGAKATEELIKAGNTVTFKAGDNLAIKQDGKNFIYSLKTELTGLTSAEFKDAKNNTVNITPEGITITKPADPTADTPEKTVTLNQNGLNNGGNPITNVAGNLQGAKPNSTEPTTSATAPTLGTGADEVNKNNAATVGDVLQAGWNLQNNGAAKDFVKPYDTVNFVNGLNTTAVVSTVDGTTSHVTYNVTGLPVTYTTADGTPVSKIGDKFYKVNDKGQPIDEQGNPSTKVNNNGEPIDGNGNVINAIDTAANPLKTSLVNPAPEANKTGTTSPTTLDNVTSKLVNYSDPDVNGKAPVRNNLVDLSKPENGQPNVSDNTVATVGDLRNMGWIVSSNKTTDDLTKDYSDTVKNANEVKFVGEGTAIVSGKTEGNVRTITVKVDDQTSTNNAVTPVVYTDEDGNQVYPTGKKDAAGNQIFNTKPDGSGQPVTGPVKTTINGPKGTDTPTTLSNVEGNLDGSKSNTTAPTTTHAGVDTTTPTATNYVNPHNAATVGDVLQAGWNLQGNGTAKDFVKPYDTVNFINGANTTAVVTTNTEGTASTVTYNVTGLPVTYTTADGTPISKIGDKYYKVNDKGQPVDAAGNPSTKVNNNGEPIDDHGNVINPVDTSTNPLSSNLVNPNVTNTATEPNKKTTSPTQLGNVTSGLNKYGDQVNGAEVPGSNDKNRGLVDLSKPTTGEPKVSDNTAATVGDLRNMGWIVSSNKTTDDLTKDYSDTVKNANEVKFVGEGTAIVSGKTDDKGVRTITVKVDDQISTNNSITPVNYTKKDGTKVYPKEVDNGDGTKTVKFYPNPDGTGTEISPSEVITSVNGPKGTTTPATLSNVEGNLDGAKTGTTAPTDKHDAPNTTDVTQPNYVNTHNAATVGDVLQAGWNLQNNGTAKDFVKPYDTVNFINGDGTTATVESTDGKTSTVKYSVNLGNGLKKDDTGNTISVKPADTSLVVDANGVKVNTGTINNVTTGDKAGTVEAKTGDGDKIATVGNVVNAINNAAWTATSAATAAGELGAAATNQLVKAGDKVTFEADKNIKITQDGSKFTFATKDEVTFKTVDTGTLSVGSPNTYTDGKGNTYTKVGENYYKPADVENGVPKQGATPVDVTTTPVTPVSPVTMKAEAAKPATNNATDAQPSSALNVTSKDGKPTQITGVASTLNTKTVDTTPAGTAPGTTPNPTQINLVDLEGTNDAPVNKNAAATVGDLQNMGWVVSTKDGNGYKDVVKNANVVDFKGDQGVTVTGKTLADGTREITVGIKEGEVTNKVTITHGDGSKIDAVKIGDNYYKVDKDGKPVGFEKGPDGKPAGTPLNVDPNTDKVTNAGAGFVTGNTVANAIQDSGWNVGIGSTDKDFSKDAKVYDKVNPNDDVKFSNGANTNVSMVTVDALNEDGTKKATTYVKVDINRDLKIDSVTTGGTATDKNGNNLVKVGDQYYKEGDVTIVTNPDGTTTVTPKENAKAVPPADVIPPKDGAMIVKNADGKDVVSATVGKDGNGAFGINGKDGKNGISMTAKDGQGTIGVNGKDGKSTTIAGDTITIKDKDNNATNIGVNTITLVDKAGNTTTTTADKSEIKDAAGNINANTATGNTLKDPNGNTHTSTASTSELKDKDGNTNTSTPTTNVLKDTNGNTNTSAATGTTYADRDKNTTTVGPKEIVLKDKDGNNTSKLTNNDLVLNTKDSNTGVEKTSHMSGDKISFNTTDEIEKDPITHKPVIDPKTNLPKIKNPGNSTEYTNEGLKVIPNSAVKRDVNGNPTFLDKKGDPVMKDTTDGKYKYVGQDGKPGKEYTGGSGDLKPNVIDTTRVISFGMDKPVLDKDGNPVKGPDGKPVMTEGISAGMQQIHNVAPGTKDTDAVNVSQLKGIAGNVVNISNRMNRMGAQAAALAGLQSIQYDPLEPTQISAGVGHYKGSSALALGVNHFKNESTMFHMGASFNGHGDETMMNASVTWKFGARADETAVKDTFRQGPISASYTLQDKVSALESQNKIQKDQLNELRATNAAQKAENEAQREELALMKAQIAELFKRVNG